MEGHLSNVEIQFYFLVEGLILKIINLSIVYSPDSVLIEEPPFLDENIKLPQIFRFEPRFKDNEETGEIPIFRALMNLGVLKFSLLLEDILTDLIGYYRRLNCMLRETYNKNIREVMEPVHFFIS